MTSFSMTVRARRTTEAAFRPAHSFRRRSKLRPFVWILPSCSCLLLQADLSTPETLSCAEGTCWSGITAWCFVVLALVFVLPDFCLHLRHLFVQRFNLIDNVDEPRLTTEFSPFLANDCRHGQSKPCLSFLEKDGVLLTFYLSSFQVTESNGAPSSCAFSVSNKNHRLSARESDYPNRFHWIWCLGSHSFTQVS